MPDGKHAARRVYALAARLGVGMGEACDHAGIARSTPPRWKNGTKPRPQQLALLRHSILAIAEKRGTVEADADSKHAAGPLDRNAALIALAAMRDAVFRLEVALGIRDDVA